MILRYPKTIHDGSQKEEQKTAVSQVEAGKDDACRCKEVSEMSPRELLKLMMHDLAFWKKTKKE
jgi:hypothetical protein